MTTPTPQRKSIAPEAQAIYDAELRHKVEPQENGKYLSLDVVSGDYEVDADDIAAGNRLLGRQPNARMFTFRIGYPTMGRFGGPRLPKGASKDIYYD